MAGYPDLMDISPAPEQKASLFKPSGGPPPPGIPPPGSPASSPWTTRWEEQKNPIFRWNNTTHSGLAPEFPRIDDPVHSLDTSFTADPLYGTKLTPDDEDLDILFRTETYQEERMVGLHSWQAPALNRWVCFDSGQIGPISGGHLPTDTGINADNLAQVYDTNKLKVDESKWFLFLQRRRWYDWIEQKPPGVTQGRVWSVDDPKLWNELSIILELVNRMFKALIEDKNEALETILFGRIETWGKVVPDGLPGCPRGPDALVLLSYNMERAIAKYTGDPFQYEHIRQLSQSQWSHRLEEILGTHLWSFIQDEVECEARDCAPSGFNFTSITLLGCFTFNTLINHTLTVAERCSTQVYLAVTIMHELCHSIFAARWQNYLPFPQYTGKVNVKKPIEPYVDFEGITELGHIYEQLYFGGSMTPVPTFSVKNKAAVILGVVTHQVPNVLLKRYNGIPGDWQEPGAILRGLYVPSSWTSKLLSEAFWADDKIPKKSERYFHRPLTFMNDSVNVGDRPAEFGDVQADPDALGPESTLPDVDKMTVQTWNERRELWLNVRETWFDEEYSKWHSSPWSRVLYLMRLDDFVDAFAKRDEITCAGISEQFTHIINWSADRETFLAYMPEHNRHLSSPWVIHCIGLLMQAAIPIRTQELERSRSSGDWTYSVYPSLHAAAAGHTDTINLWQHEQKTVETVLPNKFYNQVSDKGQKKTGITQFDYLDLVVSTVSEVSQYAPVYHSWVSAIIAAYHVLHEDREKMRQILPKAHQTRWASRWPFKLPAYDQNVGRFKGQSFVPLKWNKDGDLVYENEL